MTWKTIYSAPKDGSRFIAFESGYGIFITWWDYDHDGGRGGFRNHRHGWSPTHWQPLPEPPEVESNGQH